MCLLLSIVDCVAREKCHVTRLWLLFMCIEECGFFFLTFYELAF